MNGHIIDLSDVDVHLSLAVGGKLTPPDEHGGWMILDIQPTTGLGMALVVFGRRQSYFAACICEAMRNLTGYVSEHEAFMRAMQSAQMATAQSEFPKKVPN